MHADAAQTTRRARAYLAWLHEQGYAKTTVARRMAAVRSWCRFLCRQGTLKANPADGLRGPRQDKKLPHFLGEADVARLLEAPPADQPLGLRDRAFLEVLYSAGLRVSELVGLNVDDLDLDAGMVTVRGKGKRERLALLGTAALEGAAALAGRCGTRWRRRKQTPAVFLNKNGGRLTVRSVGRLLEQVPGRWPAWTRAPARTRCGTASPRTCSTAAPTSAACRSCWATAA